MKPTLDQICLERVKFRLPGWASGRFLHYDGVEILTQDGAAYMRLRNFIGAHYQKFDWEVWEEQPPEPQSCPDCGGLCMCAGGGADHWVRCAAIACGMAGPARATLTEAIEVWNRIKVEE